MKLRELYIQEDNWVTHKDLANMLYKHTGNKQLAIDFYHLESEFDSQDDMQHTGLSALDIDPFAGDRERVNRILSINKVPVKVLKMKHNDAYETVYSLLQSAPVSERVNRFDIPTVDIVGQSDLKPQIQQKRTMQRRPKPDDNGIDYSKSKAHILQQLSKRDSEQRIRDIFTGKKSNPEKPLPPGSIKGFQSSTKPVPHKSQAGKPQTPNIPQRKPRADDNPQHAAGIDPVDNRIDILMLQQQGMNPIEIVQYLQDTLGLTRSQATAMMNDNL